MKSTSVAILGTRGIPNNYGGFEQCAQYLAIGLVKRGFEVTVYNSHNHAFQGDMWEQVHIVHCYDPEHKLGTAGQFIYDFNCILDARSRQYDVILQLGYTSSSIWGWMLPRKSIITTNMDGLEWKRSKFSSKTKKFLLYAEYLGVKYSDYLISDSRGIQEYIKEKYKKDSEYIAYGATVFSTPNQSALLNYNVKAFKYDMLIARLEPENSIELILDGVVKANQMRPFLVVGKHASQYGKYLKDKYAAYSHIRFIGGIYDIDILNNLRFSSNIYFHGHTVGGTNPSLLEAMSSSALICANDNPFNRYILGSDAIYFTTSEEVSIALTTAFRDSKENIARINNNLQKITLIYDWDIIIDQYAKHIKSILPTTPKI
jgi:glycosyltransferase involved in cell wall biosynthesis